jgi:hypothetical protein
VLRKLNFRFGVIPKIDQYEFLEMHSQQK